MGDLNALERRLWSVIDGHRDGLVDATIYGMPAIAWPDVAKHDYLVAVKASAKKVSLYIRRLEDTPEVLDEWPALKRLHTGKVTLAFTQLDDDLCADLDALLGRLHREYVAAHA